MSDTKWLWALVVVVAIVVHGYMLDKARLDIEKLKCRVAILEMDGN